MQEKSTEVGVIVARFQIDKLHTEHENLILYVQDRHPKVIICLGVSQLKTTINNPLDWKARRQMIQETHSDIDIIPIKDTKDDQVWSDYLDSHIHDLMGPTESATLYGGRDSFISHYKGKYKTVELESDRIVSASEVRDRIKSTVTPSADFRAGVIWATQNRYPATVPTVDIAILDHTKTKVLMGKKPGQSHWRFVGGFAEPNSDCYELDARREVLEETGCEVTMPKYIGSAFIDDWRFAKEKDKVKTLFFVCELIYGHPRAADDICEVGWVDIDPNMKVHVGGAHHVLWDMLIKYYQSGGKI